MSMLAVKAFVQQTAASATVPVSNQWITSIKAIEQPPKLAKLGQVSVDFVSRVTRHERRATMPRGGGNKELLYIVDLDIYATATDEANGGRDFDEILDAISTALRSVSLANTTTITDPRTAATYQLLSIGEEIEDQLFEPELTETQGRVEFHAVKRIPVTVWVTG